VRCASAEAERPEGGLRAGPAYVVIPQGKKNTHTAGPAYVVIPQEKKKSQHTPRNFFALLRFDEQTKLLVEIDGVSSARSSSTLTIANASTNSSSFGCCCCCALVPSSWACHWQSIQQVRLRRGRKLRADFCECTGAKKVVALT
jgi:hypothetical protein